jgi:transposase-like protein
VTFAEQIMHAAQRAPRMNVGGAASAKKILTSEEKVTVRRLFNSGVWTVAGLAREFDVSQTQIRGCVA